MKIETQNNLVRMNEALFFTFVAPFWHLKSNEILVDLDFFENLNSLSY